MNLIKLTAILDLLRKGEEVSNKEAWKTGQITATAVAGLLLALANVAAAYGYKLPAEVTADTVTTVASAFISAVNIIGTLITSKSVGILPEKSKE